MTQPDQTLPTVEVLQGQKAGSPTSDNHGTLSSSDSLQSIVTNWLERAQACFDEKDVDQFVDLFSEDGYWRDVSKIHIYHQVCECVYGDDIEGALSLVWQILTIELDFNSLAKSSIKPYLSQHKLSLPALKNIKLDRLDQLKVTEDGRIQSFIKFETEVYRGTGLLKLIDTRLTSSSTSKAFLFFVSSSKTLHFAISKQ
jgi:hypothetical protein